MSKDKSPISSSSRTIPFMKLQYEFETMEELQEAMKNLSNYHDCEKCHGKIVVISQDGLGNSCCGYCGKIVKYPRLKKGKFEEFLKSIK